MLTNSSRHLGIILGVFYWGYFEWNIFLSFSACSLLVYIKSTDHCVLILCLIILLNVFTRCKSILVSLEPFEYRIISSANSKILMSSFLIYSPLISFSCLSISTILYQTWKSVHLCLPSDFRGNVFSFPHLAQYWL
jgi:hypothetical protein